MQTFICLLTLSLPTPCIGKCVLGTFFAKSAKSSDRNEVTMELMLPNMTTDIFPPISTKFVKTLLYHAQPQALSVISLNLHVVLKCHIENWIDLSRLY